MVWGGSATVEPLYYGIDSSCVNEYSTNGDNIAEESNTSTSSSSSNNNDIAGGGSDNGINSTNRFNQETTEATSLYNNDNLSDSETDPVVKKNKKKPYSQIN